MSHELGKVRFNDGAIFFYEYNGTVDFVCTALRRSPEELLIHWRADNQAECVCGSPSENVRIMTFYGPGSSWDGQACRKCMAITGGLDPDEAENHEEGIPDWSRTVPSNEGESEPLVLEVFRVVIAIIIVAMLLLTTSGVTLLALAGKWRSALIFSPAVAVHVWAFARLWRFYWNRHAPTP